MKNFLFVSDEIYNKNINSGGLANYLSKTIDFLLENKHVVNLIYFTDHFAIKRRKNLTIYYLKKINFLNKKISSILNLYFLYPVYIFFFFFLKKI